MPTVGREARDVDVLAFDPWAGDRDSDARTLRDKMGVTRVAATCAICFEVIPIGARVRMQTQQSDSERKVMTFKFCPTCCEAMAVYADDDEPMEARYALGMRNAQTLREQAVAKDSDGSLSEG